LQPADKYLVRLNQMNAKPLFDRIRWRDPISGAPLEPIVQARTPSGVPMCGALRIEGTQQGYPIVDCVARMTPELAASHREWLVPMSLEPPRASTDGLTTFQDEASVDSFGFQWNWTGDMRSDADLVWRVAEQFKISPTHYRDKLVLDAGAGAGDQSRWMVRQGAEVASIDLSSAIEVVARKLRHAPGWVGVQGDITAPPFAPHQFEIVYCEGVLQHTRDSAFAVTELKRLLRPGGLILATHYEKPVRRRGLLRMAWTSLLRRRLNRMDRYKLLLLTGNLAALSSIPGLGRLIRLSGSAVHYDLMPDLKTTWTNTFDYFGYHTYQRHVSGDDFWSYFRRAGDLQQVYRSGTRVVARYIGDNDSAAT
jgi:SAM-dependent methyltransferase